MAGRGPAPKDPSTRVRRNAAPSTRTIEVKAGTQPELPEFMPGTAERSEDGEWSGVPWPPQTVAWWRMWRDHPLADEMTDSDWSFLLDTALLHGAYWNGDLKQGPELRQRVAKFGATPEDRARLRISFAVADKSEREAAKKPASAADGKPAAKKKAADPRTLLAVVN